MVLKNQRQDRNKRFRQALLIWARSNLRDYPWRKTGTSTYEILIAELLLKRTTAAAAVRLYSPFMERYPTAYRLADASLSELASMLKPLGLSRQRSRAIRALAETLARDYEGRVPATLEQLRSLPAIGDYAARAIMSFGHDIPLAVVDGNVKRVLCRVFQHELAERSNTRTVQNMVDDLLPQDKHRTFGFALLDLGSLVCRPAMPSCSKCPLRDICDYAESGNRKHSGFLRALRQARKMSQSTLARRAQVTKLTIINTEAGRTLPRKETLTKIARALEIPERDIREGLQEGSSQPA